MIFAVGGGKAIDTCKLVSIDFEKPYFSFPTIASNCAPTSAVSIVYNEDGTFCKFVHFLEPAKHVFINTEIIANAPKEFFTLVKMRKSIEENRFRLKVYRMIVKK